MARAWREFSQRNDCAVIAVSSVARAWYSPEKAQDLREMNDATVYLGAAKESGDFEFAMSWVIFVDVVSEAEPGRDFRLGRLGVAKCRAGEGLGKFAGAKFYGATGRWEPWSDQVVEASQERVKRSQTHKNDSDEEKMLAAIIRQAQVNEPTERWRTRSQWKTYYTETGIAKNRMEHAITRLIAKNEAHYAQYQPAPGHQKAHSNSTGWIIPGPKKSA